MCKNKISCSLKIIIPCVVLNHTFTPLYANFSLLYIKIIKFSLLQNIKYKYVI